MTDELELLLEEEEDRETQELPEVFLTGGGTIPGRTAGVKSGDAPSGTPEFSGKKVWDGEEQEGARMKNREPEEEASSAAGERTASEFAEETETGLLSGGILLQESAGRFYRTLRRKEWAADYHRTEEAGTVREVKRQEAGTQATDAADLDRLLQRDARRYDGGFTWH